MAQISHALVLPEDDFMAWFGVTEGYTEQFERVAIIRTPAGNDLNRYRNVTAVEAPGVWFKDDALAHISRAYPNVVRVDLIKATTPEELAKVLNDRIQLDDRFGEEFNEDHHIRDRFILTWPSDARPARILAGFGRDDEQQTENEGIDVYAPQGAVIRSAADGKVATVARQPTALGYGHYVQIVTIHEGVTYLVTYGHLQDISVEGGQNVSAGEPIAEAGEGETIRLTVQKLGDGERGYILPDVTDPVPMLYWEGLRLRPVDDGLRIREKPGTEFEIVAKVNRRDELETLEHHGRTLKKLGVEQQWLRVRTPLGIEGYTAAWFLTVKDRFSEAKVFGMNLDARHRLGLPDAARLNNIHWVRVGYDVSMERGSTDVDAAYRLYKPVIERYARAGKKVMLVFTHETFGEGAGYIWPQMDSGKWRDLTNKFVNMVRRIVQQYAGQGLVHAYQIWNEQDTPPEHARAAVPIPPGDYAYLLTNTIRVIRSIDPSAQIISGGHVGGPAKGPLYARATLGNMPGDVRPDGIALHPYGRGAISGGQYSIFGSISESVDRYSRVLPGKPVWITEWGVLDRQGIDPPEMVTKYALDFLDALNTRHIGQVEVALWYAWADSMDNGYGLVDHNDQPKIPLYPRLTAKS